MVTDIGFLHRLFVGKPIFINYEISNCLQWRGYKVGKSCCLFTLLVRPFIADCDETIEAETGTFSSPNYPNNYPNNQRCTYTIIVPVGSTIQLTFTAFDTEENNFGAGCFDYVTIDGGAEMCGTNVPNPVSSESNRITVIFSSDYSQVRRGFSASFTSQAGSNDAWTASDSWGVSNPGGPTSAAPSVNTPSEYYILIIILHPYRLDLPKMF
ncbi:hypothetical protein SNE40_002276 [Patella caerulea]|uniref:CUB domain-containing protein n=1 Tax=Patella caerulea TaxID=87958 RepID=A0AAN8K5I0_PATCE